MLHQDELGSVRSHIKLSQKCLLFWSFFSNDVKLVSHDTLISDVLVKVFVSVTDIIIFSYIYDHLDISYNILCILFLRRQNCNSKIIFSSMITFQAFFKNQGDASKIEVLRMLNWRPKQIFVLRTFLAKTLEECNIYECYSILYCSFYGAATNYYHTIFILNSFTLNFFALFLSQCTYSSFNQFFNKILYYLVARYYAYYMNTCN